MTNSLEPSASFGSTDPSPKAIWRWRFEDASGRRGDRRRRGLRRHRLPLAERRRVLGGRGLAGPRSSEGVDAVTLFEGDREVYGPMSLHASA